MFNSKGPILLGLVPHGFRFTPETAEYGTMLVQMGTHGFQLKQSRVWNYAYPDGYTRVPTENSSAHSGHFTLGFSNLFFMAFPFHFTFYVSRGGRSYIQRDFPLTRHLPEVFY